MPESGTNNYLIHNTNVSYTPIFNITKSQLLKINPNGILLDSLNFNNNFLFESPLINFNNFYYCYGTIIKTYGPNSQSFFSTLYKIDQNLNIVKTAIIDTSYNDIINYNKVTIKNNSLFIGNAHSGTNKIYFYKTDLNLIKKDSMVTQGGILSDLINYGDKILASGNGFAQGSPFGNNQVMELDTNFNILSRFNLDNLTYVNPAGCGNTGIGITFQVANLYYISSTKYAVSGFYPVVNSPSCSDTAQNIVSIIENNTQAINTKVIGKKDRHNVIISTTSSGYKRYNYIFTTAMTGYNNANPYPPQTNTTQILVHKIDTAGNITWAKYFSSPNIYYDPYGVYATPDSGVIVCGMRYNLVTPAVPNACEGFVMKIDKNGDQVFVGIHENGNINVNYHKCFPNPSRDLIYFDFLIQENIEIKIYNTLGKQIKKISEYQNLSKIDISDLPAGAYFYNVITKNNSYSGKVLKD